VKAVSRANPIGDGLTCYFCYETKVIPEVVSHDGHLNSLGGIFYMGAVELAALLIRAVPMGKMTSGHDQVTKGLDCRYSPMTCGAKGANSTTNIRPNA
jgi:hypothetical protein